MIRSFFSQRLKVLNLVIYTFALLLVYLPVHSTITLLARYIELQQRSNDIKPAIRKIEKPIDLTFFKGDDFTKRIFQSISHQCDQNNVVIKRIDLPVETATNETILLSQKITLNGGFIDILKTLDGLKDSIAPIKLATVTFQTEEENKITRLSAHIVFQSVKIKEHEND